eukprot:1699869-Amphidinium_carterae.1
MREKFWGLHWQFARSDTELSLLTDHVVNSSGLLGKGILGGQVHSDEVTQRCNVLKGKELHGWRLRHAHRLAAAAKVRDEVAGSYDIHPGMLLHRVRCCAKNHPGFIRILSNSLQDDEDMICSCGGLVHTRHLKLVVRPGEAEFVKQANTAVSR